MRIFTADNETVLTFAGTLFTIETARAFVSHPPFSLASRAIPRLAAHQGKSPDRPSPIALIASPRLPPSPARRLRAIIRRYYFILARASLASRSNRVARAYPSVALFQFPESGAPTDLGVIVAPKPPSRIADRTATLALRRIAFEDIFSILSRARTVDVRLRRGRGVRTSRAAIAVGNVRRGRSWLTHSTSIVTGQFSTGHDSRMSPIARRTRLARALDDSSARDADGWDRRRRSTARRRRATASFVRSSAREVVVVRRPVVAVVARGREGRRARGTARARERRGSTRGAEDGDGSSERCRW